MALGSLKLATELLVRYGGGKASNINPDDKFTVKQNEPISYDLGLFKKHIGLEIPTDYIIELFTKLGACFLHT